GQTGASLSLRGTEGWDDMVVEFTLDRYREGFWAYARYKDPAHFVRIGLTQGTWLLQQRDGAHKGPALLGRAPLAGGVLPARVREEAVEAAAISPRWLTVDADGGIKAAGLRDRDVLWSFAGYYHCRLVPEADLRAWSAARRPAGAAEALAARLAGQAEGLSAG